MKLSTLPEASSLLLVAAISLPVVFSVLGVDVSIFAEPYIHFGGVTEASTMYRVYLSFTFPFLLFSHKMKLDTDGEDLVECAVILAEKPLVLASLGALVSSGSLIPLPRPFHHAKCQENCYSSDFFRHL